MFQDYNFFHDQMERDTNNLKGFILVKRTRPQCTPCYYLYFAESFNLFCLHIYTVVAVSGAGVIILSIIICCCYLKRRRSQQSGPDKENIEKFLIQHGSLAPKRYKYSEIKKITKSFKDKLGQGGFGSVYQGMLPNGSPVAVKVLINSDSNGEEFINEVASISRTSHVNIVNLLGFCYDGNKKVIVYEFMPNKSLDKFISPN
ncbi:UNVERIFIED_CONTAM: Rust resistance kinase Lr10 [Sesamum radiatum]|uniref:Rust resistance kinase Lr10 n=1 Tax=Sesamum radiatum TaxID=300843 RepID=A0AAW2V8R3_SESRA